jgi:hypothetical protein
MSILRSTLTLRVPDDAAVAELRALQLCPVDAAHVSQLAAQALYSVAVSPLYLHLVLAAHQQPVAQTVHLLLPVYAAFVQQVVANVFTASVLDCCNSAAAYSAYAL